MVENQLISTGNSMLGFFVPYKRMSELVYKTFRNTKFANATTIDIYVDMNSLTKELYFSKKPPLNGVEEIVSTTLNLCAHYRHYFSTYRQVDTRFFLIQSDNMPAICMSISSGMYNRAMNEKRQSHPELTAMLTQSWINLCDLSSYLPDIFTFGSDMETAAFIGYSITEENKLREPREDPIMIITKDPLAYLLFSKFPDLFILRPRKPGGVDVSDIITNCSVLKYVVPANLLNDFEKVCTPYDIRDLYSCLGMENRGIKPLASSKTVLEVMQKNYGTNDFCKVIDAAGLSVEDYLINHSLLDIYLQAIEIASNEIAVNFYQLSKVRTYDPEYVQAKNNTEYAKCPIMLDKL